jgi:hypothetical protein
MADAVRVCTECQSFVVDGSGACPRCGRAAVGPTSTFHQAYLEHTRRADLARTAAPIEQLAAVAAAASNPQPVWWFGPRGLRFIDDIGNPATRAAGGVALEAGSTITLDVNSLQARDPWSVGYGRSLHVIGTSIWFPIRLTAPIGITGERDGWVLWSEFVRAGICCTSECDTSPVWLNTEEGTQAYFESDLTQPTYELRSRIVGAVLEGGECIFSRQVRVIYRAQGLALLDGGTDPRGEARARAVVPEPVLARAIRINSEHAGMANIVAGGVADLFGAILKAVVAPTGPAADPARAERIDGQGYIYDRSWTGEWEHKQGIFGPALDIDWLGRPRMKEGWLGPVRGSEDFGGQSESPDGTPLFERER